MWAHYLAAFLWMLLSSTLAIQYINSCREISSGKRIIAMIVFIIGGPIFAIANILTAILDSIFPEGWDNEDNFKL